MSGGAWERVAAYITNGNDNLTTYGGNLVKEDTPSRYRDVYNSTVSDGTGNEMTQTADYELVNPLTGTG